MTFTDFVQNVEAQITVGYACCIFVGCHFLGNIAVMLYGGLRRLRMMCIRFKNRNNVKVKPKKKRTVLRKYITSDDEKSQSNVKSILEIVQEISESHNSV